MSEIRLDAETRTDTGKGASRRLRRLENKVPAVLYGGGKEPQSIHILHKQIVKALESESIYSSVFDLYVDGKKTERVILKDLQRHPYKPLVMHMDLQRVSAKDVLVKLIPLHYINEEEAPGVKEGGMVNHNMVNIEVRCQAQHLPEFIEVDLSQMALNDVVHVSELKLPKGVELAVDPSVGGHDHPVVSIHVNKATLIEEDTVEATEETDADMETSNDDAAEESNDHPEKSEE
jgi:large subunit ribosomal protein L25